MNRLTAILLLTSVTSVSYAGQQFTDMATVTSVQPIISSVQGPSRQVCQSNTQPQPQPSSMMNMGTALGAVLGGVVGSRFGGGNGNIVATAGGAVVGAMAGNAVHNSSTNNPNSQNCETVPGQPQQVITGYNVTARYNNRMITTQTTQQYSVGQQVPVNVSVELNQSTQQYNQQYNQQNQY
jgi:uncharacterized protein YcfJ